MLSKKQLETYAAEKKLIIIESKGVNNDIKTSFHKL